ncbi:MAG TPA: CvpA family protein [Candidatus Brocadiaceae bacterium]|nr:CvpA family protein [Candidatus Brocadiaceae bacterium]
MNWIDYIIFSTLFFAALFGLGSGPIIQVLRIIGLFFSFFLAIIFYETLGKVLQGTFTVLTSYLVGYFIILFVSCVITYIIIDVIRRLLGEMTVGVGLRLFGGILGVLKGLIFCGAIIVGLSSFASVTVRMVINTSKTAPQIGKGMLTIASVIPKDILAKVKESEEETMLPIDGKPKKSAVKKDKKPVKPDKTRNKIIEEAEENIVPPQE